MADEEVEVVQQDTGPEKIRTGNDIDVRWSLIDEDEQPYIVEGKDVSVEIEIGDKKRVRIKELETSGNEIHFIYYGKDQKYTGSCSLKFIENDGEKEMVTFDIPEAFILVPHSWLTGGSPQNERVQISFVTVTSNLHTKQGPPGPPGPAAKVGDVTAEVDANVGTPSVAVTTSGPDEQKNIHFAFHNLKGVQGERGATGGVYWPTLYVDTDMHLHIVEPAESLGTRLYIQNGVLYAIN